MSPATFLASDAGHRAATWIAQGAAVGGLMATAVAPYALSATVVATAMVACAAVVTTSRAERRKQRRLAMVRPRHYDMDAREIPLDPQRLYLGQGFVLNAEMRRRFDRLVAPSTAFPVEEYKAELVEIGKWPSPDSLRDGQSAEGLALEAVRKEGGDPRLLGLGVDKMRSIWLPIRQLDTHLGVWGRTGSGKTRAIEAILSGLAAMGHAILVIDPKGDGPLTSLLYNLALIYERLWTWVSLANVGRSAQYNPLANYATPQELFDKIKAIIPENPQNPFWSDTPAVNAGLALVVWGWVRELMRSLGSDGCKLTHMNYALGFAMQRAADAKRAIAVEDVQWGWERVRAGEVMPVDPDADPGPWRTTVDGLTPGFQHLFRLAVAEPRCIVAMAGKALHPQAFVGIDAFRFADYEGDRTRAAQAANPKAGKFMATIELFLRPGSLPFEPGWNPAAQPLPSVDGSAPVSNAVVEALWAPVLAGMDSQKRVDLATAVKEIRQNAECVLTWSRMEDQERRKYCSTLETGLAGFGGKWDLVSGTQSQLDPARMMQNGEIGYVTLSTMLMGVSAAGFAKVLIGDIKALAGRINAGGSGSGGKHIYLVIDELASFVTPELAQVLQQARSAGVHIITLAQYRSGLVKPLGGTDAVHDFTGNQGLLIQLACADTEEAQAAADQMLKCIRMTVSGSNSVGPSAGDAGHGAVSGYTVNTGRNFSLEESSLVHPQQLQLMPSGCAVVTIHGIPHLVQFPRVLVDGGVDWYQQIREPLPQAYIDKLIECKLPIPDWHHQYVSERDAKAKEAA